MNFRRRVRLAIRSRDNVDAVADLVWEGGTVQIRHAVPSLAPAINRWIAEGLSDGVGEKSERVLRHTPSTDPLFLEHLNDYLSRVSGFIPRLEIYVSPPVGWMFHLEPQPTVSLVTARKAVPKFAAKDSSLREWTLRQLESTDTAEP